MTEFATQVTEVVEMLLKSGADVNARDNAGGLPSSTWKGLKARGVGALLASGADATAVDNEGAACFTTWYPPSETLRMLLDAGAELILRT